MSVMTLHKMPWLLVALCATLTWSAGCSSKSSLSVEPKPSPDSGKPVQVEEMTVDMAPVVPRGPMAGLAPMRLLTRYEYDNTAAALLGFEVAITAVASFPSENLVDGFENNAWSHRVSPLLLSKYMDAADELAARAFKDHRDKLPQCDMAALSSEACADAFLSELLPRAFRRPVSAEETAELKALFMREVEARGVEASLEMVLAAILQSPQFLYRVELFEQSSAPAPPLDGGMSEQDFELVGDYELANRLSYFLWASMPDEELFAAASRGELSSPEQVRAQVTRMLTDERAKAMVHEFHRQWLGLKTLDTLVKSKTFYPQYDESLRDDFRASLNAFIDYAYWEEGTFEAFMTSNVIYLTPDLAPLYQVQPPEGEQGLFKYVAPINERAGILTQPALMSVLANSNQSSPILRGIFVRERMLCQHVPPPPNNIQIVPPDPDPNATTREIFAIHTANDQCAGCHTLIDPLGFGFESYDGIGHYRTMENGIPVDVSGEVTSSPDPTLNGKFNGTKELALRLVSGDVAQSCLAEQWFQFALGRPFDESDKPSLDAIKSSFKGTGYQWASLFESIATSDSFRYRRKDQANPTANQ